MTITRDAVRIQAKELEEALWGIAERLGLERSSETKQSLLSLASSLTLENAEYIEAVNGLKDGEDLPIELLQQPDDPSHVLAVCFRTLSYIIDEDQISDETLRELCETNFLAGILEWETVTASKRTSLNQVFSTYGRSGAIKRHAKMAELQVWAIENYRAGKWRSANQAAHDLKPRVTEYGRKIGAVLTEENAQRTIAEWIRKSV